MKTYVLSLVFRRHNPDILRRNKAIDPLDGLPQEGVFSNNLEHLFRPGLTAQGPEPDARATRKDYCVCVIK